MMASVVVLAVGLLSVALYLRKRRWIDALLVALAALALAGLLANLRMPLAPAGDLAIASALGSDADAATMAAAAQARALTLTGPGLREAQWRDLPARPLRWQAPADEMLWLDFPRTLAQGRMFALTVRRAPALPGWRLQLLAENQQVLAEAAADKTTPTTQLTVQWLPPVAEVLLLRARLLDAAGKTLAQGPVPLQVSDSVPLQVQGRFDAPSFDARALNQLLTDGGAQLDWQVTLGKGIARSETAATALTQPNLLVADAAYVERLQPAARAALLAQVAQGRPLLILGGNASDSAMWQREFGLRLQPQSPTTEKEDTRHFALAGGQLALAPASLNPDQQGGPAWQVQARTQDSRKLPWLWQRPWQQGRLVWLGVADWHRYAITAPAALQQWWQLTLDQLALASPQKLAWRLNDPMPLPGLRSELCAQGVAAGVPVQLDGAPGASWQARGDRADSVCVAAWPRQAGWQSFSSAGQTGRQYVYAPSDWPAWQRGLRHDATRQYAARLDGGAANATVGEGPALPAAPFGIAFALCMLALWWREQR